MYLFVLIWLSSCMGMSAIIDCVQLGQHNVSTVSAHHARLWFCFVLGMWFMLGNLFNTFMNT